MPAQREINVLRTERPKHIPFDLAGHAKRPHRSIGDRRHLRDPVRTGRALCGYAAAPVPAFVASYQSALAVSDIITAVLLLSQFAVLRTRALLLLSTGYLFTAAAAVIHALTFPGLFAPTGLFGAGPQTTVWLYMIWHGGFPLFVLAYAWLKEADGGARIAGSTAPRDLRQPSPASSSR